MFKQAKLNGVLIPYFIDEYGNLKNEKGELLKPYMIRNNKKEFSYKAIKLKRLPKGHQHQLIHRLIAMTWIGNIPDVFVVNHIDGNKLNNHVSNLEIITFDENVKHAVDNELMPVGEKHRLSKHTNEEIHELCKLMASGKYTTPELSKMLGYSTKFIDGIKFRRKWKSISKHYDFSKMPKANKLFTDDEMEKILEMMDCGMTNKEIIVILQLPNIHKYRSAISYIRVKRFNDYLEREYTQVSGKSGPLVINIG